jgi:hypothetical protein
MGSIGISLGWNCYPAMYGVGNNLRGKKENGYKTCPFDECVSNYDGIIKCLNDDFKFFLHKRTLADDDTAKIFFYDLNGSYDVTVEVNNIIIDTVISNHYLMNLKLHHDDVFSLFITYNGNKQNLIHLYNNISHNKIIITDVNDCNNL